MRWGCRAVTVRAAVAGGGEDAETLVGAAVSDGATPELHSISLNFFFSSIRRTVLYERERDLQPLHESLELGFLGFQVGHCLRNAGRKKFEEVRSHKPQDT